MSTNSAVAKKIESKQVDTAPKLVNVTETYDFAGETIQYVLYNDNNMS